MRTDKANAYLFIVLCTLDNNQGQKAKNYHQPHKEKLDKTKCR